jgi:hypothetical protein
MAAKSTRSARKSSGKPSRKPARRTPSRPAAAAAGKAGKRPASTDRWSKHVMETSDAMDLEAGVFKKSDPHAIAVSLKHSAESSSRRKAGAFQSAMSMLNFYINRAGGNLSAAARKRLEAAKKELRSLYGRD